MPIFPLNLVSQGSFARERTGDLTDLRFQNVANLIVKVTHRCNLDCWYCYENITAGKDMSVETFKNLVDKVLFNTQSRKILFIFHGGEPTLLTNKWFTECMNYAITQSQIYSKMVAFAMQSNFISLSEDKLKLFRDFNVKLSTSLDGPPDLPNSMRSRVEKALENYISAQKNGFRPGILMTINQSNYAYFPRIMDWLEKEVGELEFKANVVSSVGHGYNLPDILPEQVFQANVDILEYMIATKGQRVIEENLSLELLRFFASPQVIFKKPLCRTQHCGAGKRVLGVTTDGNLLPCGRFQWDDSNYYLGAISDTSIGQSSKFVETLERFHASVPETWYDCNSCPAGRICSFGCQAFIVRSKSKANVECLPTKMRYKYYQENQERLLPLVESLRQRRSDLFAEYRMSENHLEHSNYTDKYSDYSDYQDYSDYKDYSDYSDYSDYKDYNDYSDS